MAEVIPVLVLVTAGVFFLIHLTPGDPIDAMMAESADPGVKAELTRQLGLDQPIHVQYLRWMGGVLRGDLGRSIRNNQPVIEDVGRRIRPSLELAVLALLIALAVAFPLGILSAARRNTPVDGAGTTLARVVCSAGARPNRTVVTSASPSAMSGRRALSSTAPVIGCGVGGMNTPSS